MPKMKSLKTLPIALLLASMTCYSIRLFAQKTSIEIDSLISQTNRFFVSGKTKIGIEKAKNGVMLAQSENDASSVVHFDYMLSKFYRLQSDIDSAVACLTHANAFIQNKQDKIKIDNQLGEILLDMGASSMAIPYLKRLVSNETNLKQKFYNYNLLGRAYLLLGKNGLAINTFKDQLSTAVKLNSKHFVANAYNNMGFAFYTDSNYVKSYHYYEDCIALIERIKVKTKGDTSILVNAYQNRCLVDDAVGDRSGLIINFEKSLQLLPNWRTLNDVGIGEFKLYMQTLIRQGKIKQAEELIRFFGQKVKTNSDKLKLCEVKVEYYLSRNQIDLLKKELALFVRLRNAVDLEKLKQSNQFADLIGGFYLKSAEQVIYIKEVKETILIQKQQTKIIFFIYLLVFIGVLGVTMFYINRSKQKRLKSEQKLIEKEKENLEISLQLKQKDLSNIAIDISQRNEELEAFLQKFKGVDAESSEKVKEKLLYELRSLKNSIASKSTLNEFLKNNDIVNSAFYQKLTQLHPNLTPYEVDLCSYFLINLSVKDIANLRGISPNSVRINKMRLKKKLLLQDVDLLTYLKNL